MRYRRAVAFAAALGFVLCMSPAEAAKAGKNKKPRAAHALKHRHSAVASGFQYRNGVPKGPLYNGQDYLGDDPDPNIRSQIIRDMGTRYGGND
jgi:hypothetical protein